MKRLTRRMTAVWFSLGSRFLPYADFVTPDLSLGRLFRLSLFQVSVGMTLVLLIGTLNRVMIVELDVPAALVAVMVALPLLFAPFRTLIGFRSDMHQCALGWRRVPFIYRGTLSQFGGFAIMPFALLVLAGEGASGNLPPVFGQSAAALAFLLVGAGAHTVQTVGLALATDLTRPESHPRVVGLMYVMLLLGMMISALIFGGLLQPFTPGRLVQVIQGVAVLTVLLNFIALWKQEPRRMAQGVTEPAGDPSFRDSWRRFCSGQDAVRRLIILGLGTMGFGMADIVLEPYGGEVLGLSVAATTKLTALLAFGGLAGFTAGWIRLARGGDAYRIAQFGAVLGLPAFGLIILAAPAELPSLFLLGNFLVGFAGALFWHGTLTATMNRAPANQAGLALGAWGAVQATAAGLAMGMSGVIRDVMTAALAAFDRVLGVASTAGAYISVYALEVLLLMITVVATIPLIRRANAAGGAQVTGAGEVAGHVESALTDAPADVRDAAE